MPPVAALVFLIEFKHSHKSLGRQLNRAERTHLLLAFLLLFEQLLLTRDIAAVALGQYVLAEGLTVSGER